MKEQRIRDPIHNLIKFSPSNEDDKILWALLQTSWMQRLRRIKQLGFSDFVYPGNSHTRFSHSLGALQIARRMLDVFERKGLLGEESGGETHPLMKRATLCAVLLHDVGHGPYSHVFENVLQSPGVKHKQTHEDYTKEIVSGDEEIKEILTAESESSEFFEKVSNFFRQESGNDQYSRIVSSQLDADRLDFLIRDRYFCGAQFGAIDLEWLLDSIVIEKIPHPEDREVNPYTFCFSEKGKTVAEDFVMAYVNMYQNVYYHKAVDAVEMMVIEILKETYKTENKKTWRQDDPLGAYFSSESEEDRLRLYKNLDDSSVIEAIKWASDTPKLGEAHEFSERFLRRYILKSLVIRQDDTTRISDFQKRLEDKSIWYRRKVPKPKGFKEYLFPQGGYLKNLWIMKAGTPVTLHTESDIVKSVKEISDIRFYFKNDDDRDKAIKVGKEIGMQF